MPPKTLPEQAGMLGRRTGARLSPRSIPRIHLKTRTRRPRNATLNEAALPAARLLGEAGELSGCRPVLGHASTAPATGGVASRAAAARAPLRTAHRPSRRHLERCNESAGGRPLSRRQRALRRRLQLASRHAMVHCMGMVCAHRATAPLHRSGWHRHIRLAHVHHRCAPGEQPTDQREQRQAARVVETNHYRQHGRYQP